MRPESTPSVLAIQYLDKPGASEIRILTPFVALKNNGWRAGVLRPPEFHLMTSKMFSTWDIIVLSHLSLDFGGFDKALKLARAGGKKVVFDISDDPLHPRCWNNNPVALENIERVLSSVDAVTAHTEYVRDKIKHLNPNTYVLPNCVNLKDFQIERLREPDDPVFIGLQGGESHHEDWKLVNEPLHRIMQERDVMLYVLGYLPYYLRDLHPLWEEWVPYQEFPRKLALMDVGLAPLSSEDDFNLGKSALKAIDYMASGAVALVSDHPVYRKVGGCIRVKDDKWYERINMILDDHQRRAKLQAKGPKWVKRNRDINSQWPLWAKAYQDIWRQNDDSN